MKLHRILAAAMSLVLMLCLAACGGAAPDNILKIGDYEAEYTKCFIATDADEEDSVVIEFNYTNNSSEDQSFEWSYYYTVSQDGEELESSIVWLSEDSYDSYGGTFEDVAPGESAIVYLTYKVNNLTSPVVIEATDLFETEKDSVTVDLTAAE